MERSEILPSIIYAIPIGIIYCAISLLELAIITFRQLPSGDNE